jgi:hypothetical protein
MSRCPQWPGHLSTVAGGILGGRYGEFQSNSTPRFPISLAAKESFAPRKNFTIHDHPQPLYQRKCGDCRARTGHDGTVACPLAASVTGTRKPHFSSAFRPFGPHQEGRYSIRVKHLSHPPKALFSTRMRAADGDGRTCTAAVESCVDYRWTDRDNHSHAQVHVHASRAPDWTAGTGNHEDRFPALRKFQRNREPVVQTSAEWRSDLLQTPAMARRDAPLTLTRRPPAAPTSGPRPDPARPDPGSRPDQTGPRT